MRATCSLSEVNSQVKAGAMIAHPPARLSTMEVPNMSKVIPLTQGQVAIVDDEDFGWLSTVKWCASWVPSTQSFYARRNVQTGPKRRQVRLHQVVWEHHNGPVPGGLTVDHADRDTLNDRRSNLRLGSRSQQNQNRGLNGRNTSGYRGVHFRKDRGTWQAYIWVDPKRVHLGYFTDPVDAAQAYDDAARIHFDPAFAQLNFPEGRP